MSRIIGITHRVKRTANNEDRPTLVAILEGENVEKCELEDETAELDFIQGRWPSSFRAVVDGEDLSGFRPWQIVRDRDKNPKKVPAAYDGLRAGDTVVMICGGSGDRLAYAISNHGKTLGAAIKRITPFDLKTERSEKDKGNDHILLTQLFLRRPEIFREVSGRDQGLILVRELYFDRQEAMKARIGCEQRLRSRFIGKVFLTPEGGYPEGNLEDQFDAAKANDTVLATLIKEEGSRERELAACVRKLDVWKEVFEPIEGLGEMIAARLIAAIGDIRRFPTRSQFVAYVGLHVLSDGRFPRKRSGEVANWQDDARQAFFLLGDQFNRRPDSVWGQRLREYKARLRERHPEILCKEERCPWSQCREPKKHVRIYNDGHIHKMALWRTRTKFAEQIYKAWSALYSK